MPRNGRSEPLNDLFDREDWSGARRLILPELKKTPDSHWLLDRLSVTYYEQRKYAEALRIIRKAQKTGS
jgi:predicted Zn-dependent protease